MQFITQTLTKFAESICAIGSEWLCRVLFLWLTLHLLDFYFRLTPNSFLKELVFARIASTNCLKIFAKISSYFAKIWNFTRKLTDVIVDRWQICSISSKPFRETPASTFRSPVLPRYIPILQVFKNKFLISSISLEEVVIITKFFNQNIQSSNPIMIVFRYIYYWLLPAWFPVQFFRKIFAPIPGIICY